MRITLALVSLLLALSSCASTSYSSNTTRELVARTIQSLGERVNLSEQRVYVAPFFASDREGEQATRISDELMADTHRSTVRLLRHEILGYLAPRMYVIDVPDLRDVSGLDPEKRIYDQAAEAHATLILFGRYSMEGTEIRILLRAVDVETRTVLIAEDGLVGHVSAHGH